MNQYLIIKYGNYHIILIVKYYIDIVCYYMFM